MAGQVWECVGGAEGGGIMVREGKDLKSNQAPMRLSTGAQVRQKELSGERLHFELLSGSGPPSGWVSITLKGKDLMVRSGGGAGGGEQSDEGLGAIAPMCAQTPGTPYVYYHIIAFLDTKPTGLRMSSCMGIMDESRCEAHALGDYSVEGIRTISDPHIELAIELCPAILQLSDTVATDSMLYQHPKSRGAVQSWVRAELTYGFPNFPFKSEQQKLFLVGKHRESSQRIPICTARFAKAFVDSDTSGLADGDKYAEKVGKFFGKLKSDHSTEDISKVYPLRKGYEPRGKPFEPTSFQRVKWMMSYNVGDLWGRMYHAKSPEICWDLNMLAGGSFAALVKGEPDPQSLTVSLAKQMDMGMTFDVLCFLEEASQKAVYVLLGEGGTKASDVYLCLCASYKWKDVPEDGQTIAGEDLDVIAGVARANLLKYAAGEVPKVSKALDLTKLPPAGS